MKLAESEQIPFQIAARPGRTGTDAWHMHIVREGVASGLIGLPLRYMHSPTECIDLEDLENCAKLVAAYALDPGKALLECGTDKTVLHRQEKEAQGC